jgi:hypothetical protein
MSIALVFKFISSYGTYLTTALNFSSSLTLSIIDEGLSQSGTNRLFSRLSYFIIFYFWFNRKKIIQYDIFIGIIYFAFILGTIILILPAGAVGRVLYFIFVGGYILTSKLILTNFRFGSIILLIIICDRFYAMIKPASSVYMVNILHGEYLNPTYGLVRMILNYDTFFNY